jgi:hypothetical protein
MLSAPTNCEGKGESEKQGESNSKESDHWMLHGIPDEDEEELVECDLLNGHGICTVDNAQIEDYEDEKGPELVENDCVFFAKLEGMIEELKMWKFDENYSKEEVIVGNGDDGVSEVTGREWERQGEQDPDEELSDLTEKYSPESMMAEENDEMKKHCWEKRNQGAVKSRVLLI